MHKVSDEMLPCGGARCGRSLRARACCAPTSSSLTTGFHRGSRWRFQRDRRPRMRARGCCLGQAERRPRFGCYPALRPKRARGPRASCWRKPKRLLTVEDRTPRSAGSDTSRIRRSITPRSRSLWSLWISCGDSGSHPRRAFCGECRGQTLARLQRAGNEQGVTWGGAPLAPGNILPPAVAGGCGRAMWPITTGASALCPVVMELDIRTSSIRL